MGKPIGADPLRAAARGDRHLAVVLLHSDLALTVDAARLLDYGFSVARPEPFDPGTIPQV